MIVVAGPSGSGKSTTFPVSKLAAAAFNVDDRAARLHGSYRGIPQAQRQQAQRECEDFIDANIDRRVTFAVETTLRSRAALIQAERARKSGFTTVMLYLCTSDVEENVQRIARRGHLGGHAAPADEIRDIYTKSLVNLTVCRPLFDEADLYDSTSRWVPAVRVASLRQGRVTLTPPTPSWVPSTWRSP